jgi:hypothetical protein
VDTGGAGVDKTYYTTGASPADPTTGSAVYDASSKPVLADGQRIKYFSTDQAGNQEAVKSSVAAQVDQTAPAAPTGLGTVPSSPGQTTTPRVTGAAEAGSTVRVYTTSACSGVAVASGSAATFGSAGLQVSAVAAGSTTTFYATATDGVGNTSACSTGHATYIQDTSAPRVTVSTSPAAPRPGHGGYFNAADLRTTAGRVTVHVSASDASGVAGITCTDRGRPVGVTGQTGSDPRTGSFTLAANGTHRLSCRASDTATPANTGTGPGSHASLVVSIDTAAPTITATDGTSFAAGARIHPSFRCADGSAGAGIASCTASTPATGPGRHALTIRARDHAGNTTSRTIHYRVDVPLLSLTIPARTRLARTHAGIIATCHPSALKLRSCRVQAFSKGGALIATGAAHRARDHLTLTKLGRRRLTASLRYLHLRVLALGTFPGGSTRRVKAATSLVLATQQRVTPSGSFKGDQLAPRGRRYLKRLARALGQVKTIRCVGFTADLGLGITPAARSLGLARATLACHTLKKLGVHAKFLETTRASSDPVATNRTEKGRARNRRVLLRITHTH